MNEPQFPAARRDLELGPYTGQTYPNAREEADKLGYDDGSISITEVLDTLWRRKWWVLLAGLSFSVAALGYSLLQAPLYRATAIIELNPPTVPILSNGSRSGEELIVPNTDWEFRETQFGILRSRALAERVVQDLNLLSQSDGNAPGGVAERISQKAGGLAGGLSVSPSVDSRLVNLSYVSESPEEAARIANGFATSYIQLTLDRKYQATGQARDFLKERLKTVRQGVNDAERELVQYAKDNGIILVQSSEGEGAGANSLTGASLTALNTALAVAQQKRIEAEQTFRNSAAIAQGNSGSSALRAQKAQLEAEYREKSNYLQDTFPDMIRLKSKIDELDRQIGAENQLAVDTLRAEFRAARAEEASLKARVDQLSGNALSEREDSVQYNILQRELDTARSLYDALLQRYNEVGVAEGIGTAQAAVLDTARTPTTPFAPTPLRNSILGLILGLGLGAGLAVLYERITNTIKTKEDIRDKLGIPALGAIPKVSETDSFLEAVRDPKTEVYDGYASLRTALQFATPHGHPRTLLVTSCRPAEGKSTTSLSLAVQFADAGMRALIIDADMRKPSFVMEDFEDRGLSALLTSDAKATDHFMAKSADNIALMPAGPLPPNPSNIILPSRMRQIFSEMDEHFDIIIVDAPPALGFADAALLGSACDGVLLAIECGKVRTTLAKSALNLLRLSNANILGATLTKAEGVSIDYSYSYKYYHNNKVRGKNSRIYLGKTPASRELD